LNHIGDVINRFDQVGSVNKGKPTERFPESESEEAVVG
jgi:hypothetical protein